MLRFRIDGHDGILSDDIEEKLCDSWVKFLHSGSCACVLGFEFSSPRQCENSKRGCRREL